MVPDDPFEGLGVDRTIMMPVPGGRVAPAPPPAPAAPAEPAEPVDARPVTSGLNPLVTAANPLLNIIPELRTSVQHANPNGLRDSLARGVREFEAQARAS